MSIVDEMKQKLEAEFSPRHLAIVNESHKHAGHSGDDGSGESHFHITIQSESFVGKKRVMCHRMIHSCLGPEILQRVHALGLSVMG